MYPKYWLVVAEPPTNGNVMDFNKEQSEKAPLPIDVTLSGIVMDVKEEQPWKA